MNNKASKIQEHYYNETANIYDSIHLNEERNEHGFSLEFLTSMINFYGASSILDIGSGTGRCISFLKQRHPKLKIIGIEPVEKLREIAYSKGIEQDVLIAGNGYSLPFQDNEFDFVCEFGVLHHVASPELVISEMLRVSKKAIFISDSNNFGQGSNISRFIKQIINAMGLWKVYRYIKTHGRMYEISEGDGVFYSYSVFNNYKQIASSCKYIHLINTIDGKINPYKTASHIALLGIKKNQ